MTGDGLDAGALADQVLPLDGPYLPEKVVEAARTVGELVRRLNHATWNASALRYPPQLDSTVGALRAAVYGLDQTFTQIATRLDVFGADPRIEHDDRSDPWVGCAEAPQHLRHAVGELRAVTEVLDRVTAITYHLGYDTSTAPPRRQPFPPPGPATVHEGQSTAPAVPPVPRAGRKR